VLERIPVYAIFVIGGDLILANLRDQRIPNDIGINIFPNPNTMGFHKLGPLTHEREIQTYWKTNSGPFQLNHLFADSIIVSDLGSFTSARN
jgi:hypothetical protein